MKVALTGSHGLIGTAVCKKLHADGHQVLRLVRRESKDATEISWNPQTGEVDVARLSQADALIHLAGENIANKRWNDAQKKRIRASRIGATKSLARALSECNPRPQVFISASAIGFYGDRGGEVLTETSGSGESFLANLCAEWERAALIAAEAGIRVVCARIGIGLSPDGGALAKLLPLFQLGAGGPIGAGKQWMSWIDIDDLARAIVFLLTHDQISGAVNIVAPNAVPNAIFSQVLGKVLGRPACLPAPPFALKLMLGQLADELLLSSQRVEPKVLLTSGFQFDYPDLEQSFRHLLSK